MKNCLADDSQAEKRYKRFGRTGIYVILMTFWWILPLFVLALFRYPISVFINSYYPFFVAFIVTLLISFIVNIIETRTDYWGCSGYWKKYLIVNGVYALNVLTILVVSITLDSVGLIGFFSGDPEGSFEMLYVPSVGFYLLLGLVIRIITSIFCIKRSKAQAFWPKSTAGKCALVSLVILLAFCCFVLIYFLMTCYVL